ncbi:hypothetical protein CPT03_10775 [Pedobacter ginsengisoli]|uniref:Uncharacterized protein n=1 Tax=Pedobacter ginsengisoli TaxID=363852 RepID=A0A2D1U5N7_9SPHI|nr:hypothetical protein [Pedobacter ginsengisoli]ATP56929.1 hypothetical protein CPT03_10775 [Pedobacter ginsengisoli]
MKRLTTLMIATLITTAAFAQSKNPTNKKEINDKVKQAQQQLDKLTPEQKKMIEQLGISSKVPSIPAGTTAAGINAAIGGDAFGVPSKNTALIGAIPQITLTAAMVPTYVKSLVDYVQKGVADDTKVFGQQMYAVFKTNKYDAMAIGNAAVGYWSSGQLELAVYLIGRACADNGSDADMLSNFAAMLSMGGAPHRAIPLLEYLNKQYPDNSTILNNLGQAWFYLGETDKANAQLNKVVKAFAYHPQASYTQCLIEQSKGNTPKAIENMKNSLAYSYSLDKVNQLRKLGYSVKGKDMRKPFRPDPNPLGLQNFVRPDVPNSYEQELKLGADWDAFQKQVNEKLMSLAKELLPYQQAAAQKGQQLYNQYQNAKGDVSKMTTTATQNENIYRKTAEKNLQEMNKDGGAGYRLKALKKQIDDLVKDFMAKDEVQRKSLEKQNSIKAEQETELAKKGENIGYDNCVVQQKYSEWVYTNYNKPLEEAYKNYLHQWYLKITEELYWKQFTQEASVFEATKIAAKKEWLAALGNTRYMATNKYGKCTTPENKNSTYKLADFDDMHCAYVSVLDFGVYKQIDECGKMRIEFDAGRLSGNLNFKADNNGKDKFVKATVEATIIDKEISVGKGPLQVGASVKAGMGMEISSNGIEDVYATGEASANAGSTNVGVNSRMSLISGNMSGGISGFGK